MSNYKISRRHFLTSSGTIFTLPLLESLIPFSSAFAQAAGDPKRFVSIYLPNGTCNRSGRSIWWTNPGTMSAGNTSIAYSPFAANYGDIININGLRNISWNQHGGDDHEASAKTFLTCEPNINSGTNSFDQIIADRVGKPSLVLSGGATNADLPGDRYVAYKNGVGNQGISNPWDLYRSLFSQLVPSTGTGTTTPVLSGDKSVLDSAIADFNSLNAKLSKSDRAKMEEFLTAVREVERKIAQTQPPPPSSTGCQKPTLSQDVDSSDSRNNGLYLPKLYAMNDLIKQAFACDLTRSVSIMLDMETSMRQFVSAPTHLRYNGTDINYVGGAHISISHAIENELGFNRAATRDRVYLAVVMDLVNKLKAGVDPSGSRILDNTIIFAGFGVSDGNHQNHPNRRPLVLAGGRNMMTLGRSITLGNNDYKDLYYTIASKLGLGLSNFRGSSTMINL